MAKAFLVFLVIALMQQTPDQFPICDGARSAGRSHRAACSAANRHQNHCRSAQPMSLLGQSRPSNSAPTWPFVGCCSNKRQTQTQSVCPKSANNRLVRAGYNYVETRADSSLKGNTISPHWKGWCDGRRLHTTDGCGAGEDRAWTT